MWGAGRVHHDQWLTGRSTLHVFAGMWKSSEPWPGIHIVNNNVGHLRRATLKECMAACDKIKNDNCVAITYSLQMDPAHTPECVPGQNCWLKSAKFPSDTEWVAPNRVNMVTFTKPIPAKTCLDDGLCKTALGAGIAGAIGFGFVVLKWVVWDCCFAPDSCWRKHRARKGRKASEKMPKSSMFKPDKPGE